MKKLIVLILSLVYLSTSSGMVLNVQYCFDKVSSFSLNGFGNEDSCCGAIVEKSQGCCSDEVKVIKPQESHEGAFASYLFNNPIQPFSTPRSFIDPPFIGPLRDQILRIRDSGHLLPADSEIYIKNCVFRI